MLTKLDFFVAQRQCCSGSRRAGLDDLPPGLVASLGEALPDPGAEGKLEVQSGGDGGRGPVRPGQQIGIAGTHHLDHQAGVQRMAGVDIFGEPIGVDERRVRRDIAANVVGGGDHREKLNVGAESSATRLSDGDGPLGGHLGRGARGRMGPRHREIYGRHCGQPLRGGHEGLGFVGVVGALGLAQQCGDPGEHPVIGHGATLGDASDEPGGPVTSPGGLSPQRIPLTAPTSAMACHPSALLGHERVQCGGNLRRERGHRGVVGDVVRRIVA